MAKATPRRIGLAAVGAVVLGLGIWVSASHALRDRIGAGFRGFSDPSRVRPTFEDHAAGGPLPPATELEQPDVGLDFESATAADLGDAGTLEELTLPDIGQIPITKRTIQFVGYFAAGTEGRKAFVERFRRGGRYRESIEQALRDVGAPEDLVWLAGIESAFNPQAVSPNGAVGLFQFMPETGAKYGLAIDSEVDDRRSISKSTAAGAQHLRDLFEHYGKWDLALAAYDFGKDPLDEAIARLKARRGEKNAGKPVEFKELAEGRFIPKETANFVPQIQAFAIVAANRGRFGLDDLDVMPPLTFGEMAVPGGTPLKIVAKAAGVSIATMRDYNPDLLRDHAPAGGDALVLVPADKLDRAHAAFAAIYAREMPQPGASAIAEAPKAPSEKPSASAAALPPPTAVQAPEPAQETFTLPDGIVVELRRGSGGTITIAARVELMVPTRAGGLRPGGEGYDVNPINVGERDLGKGLERIAQGLAKIDRGAGEAAKVLRKKVFASSRAQLEKAPYGSGWLALGDALFPTRSPLEGTVLVSPLQPIASIVMASEPRGGMKVTLKIDGPARRAEVESASKRAFAVLDAPLAELSPHPKVERVSAASGVTSPRLLYGWIAPPEGDGAEPAMRLALVALAHNQAGRIPKALVQRGIASHLKGALDLGEGASVATFEIDAAVPHDANDVEKALDAELDAAAASPPSSDALAAAKDVLRTYLRAERSHARAGEAKEAAAARVDSLLRKADDLSAEDVRAITKKIFAPEHRVVVTITPRR